jgi:hypothetical protein
LCQRRAAAGVGRRKAWVCDRYPGVPDSVTLEPVFMATKVQGVCCWWRSSVGSRVSSRHAPSWRSSSGLRAAAFSVLEPLDEFEFDVAEGVSAAQLAQHISFGSVGTGKTHLALRSGRAARQRRRGASWHAAELIRTPVTRRRRP